MEAGQWWFKAFWRHPLATTALYGALVVHLALALVSLYRRHHLRMPAAAAVDMVRSVARLSEALGSELPAPLRIGIGIHTGPAVVGRMGYAEGRYLTAVGDTVNAAAHLEQLTKEYDCPLVISDAVAARAGVDVSAHPGHILTLRNRAEVLSIRVIADVTSLAVPPG